MGSLVIVKYSSSLLFVVFGLGLSLMIVLCWPIASLLIWIMNLQGAYSGAFLGVLVTAFLEGTFWMIKEDNKSVVDLPPSFTKEDEDNQREDDENKDL